MDLGNTENSKWEKEAPLLASMERTNPFIVPDEYFADLGARIHSQITVESARFKEEEEFPIPYNYFDNLPEDIQARISEQAIRDVVPADGFSVEANYFSDLELKIKNRVEQADPSVTAVVKPIRNNWIKYAAAACITVALGSILVFSGLNKTIEPQLSKISDQELINYLQINSDPGDTPLIMEHLSANADLSGFGNSFTDAEIEEYINTSL